MYTVSQKGRGEKLLLSSSRASVLVKCLAREPGEGRGEKQQLGMDVPVVYIIVRASRRRRLHHQLDALYAVAYAGCRRR